MSNITDLGKNFAVLTYGRSGSNLLASNIGYGCDTYPMFVHDQSEFITNPESTTVVHSHLLYTTEQLANYTKIFNLRINSIETIISSALTDTYDFYHKFTNHESRNFEPVTLDLGYVQNFCRVFIKWHNHYVNQLTPDTYVVIYEEMIPKLSNPNKVFSRTFPDKRELVINYDEVEDFLTKMYDTVFKKITGAFLGHRNSCDIYKYLDV